MSDEILQIFKDTGALLEGHFELTSGLHSPFYWEKFRVLQFPEHTEKLCKIIAGHFKNDNIELVTGPTTGGVILAYETARQLGIRGMFAERLSVIATMFDSITRQRAMCIVRRFALIHGCCSYSRFMTYNNLDQQQ